MKTSFAHSSAITAEREFYLWIKLTQPKIQPPMKAKNNSSKQEPTEAQIQHAAYLLWIEAGRPKGRDQEHWFAAREMLRHRRGRDTKTRQRAPELAEAACR